MTLKTNISALAILKPSSTEKYILHASYFECPSFMTQNMEPTNESLPYELNDEKLRSINPKREPLTIEKLRTFKGMENLTDEQAQELLFSIQAFAIILYDLLATDENEQNNSNTNQNKQAA